MNIAHSLKNKIFGRTKAERYGKELRLKDQFYKAAMVANVAVTSYAVSDAGILTAVTNVAVSLVCLIMPMLVISSAESSDEPDSLSDEERQNVLNYYCKEYGRTPIVFDDFVLQKKIEDLQTEMGIEGRLVLLHRSDPLPNGGVYKHCGDIYLSLSEGLFSARYPDTVLGVVAHEFGHLQQGHESKLPGWMAGLYLSALVNGVQGAVLSFLMLNPLAFLTAAASFAGQKFLANKLCQHCEYEADFGGAQGLGAEKFLAWQKTAFQKPQDVFVNGFAGLLRREKEKSSKGKLKKLASFLFVLSPEKKRHPEMYKRIRAIAQLAASENPDVKLPSQDEVEVIVPFSAHEKYPHFELDKADGQQRLRDIMEDRLHYTFGHRNLSILFQTETEHLAYQCGASSSPVSKARMSSPKSDKVENGPQTRGFA